jgi:hypothetical protein
MLVELTIVNTTVILPVEEANKIFDMLIKTGRVFDEYSDELINEFDKYTLSVTPLTKDLLDDCSAAKALGVKLYEYKRDKRAI